MCSIAAVFKTKTMALFSMRRNAHDVVEGIKKFFNKEKPKAPLSMGDAGKNAFNDRVANIEKACKARASCIRVLRGRQSVDAGKS